MAASRLTRRAWLQHTAAGAGALAVSPLLSAVLEANQDETQGPRFKIGACDWSIRMRQKPEVFPLAEEIGLDGVEVSFSEPGSEHDLREEAVRKNYLALSEKHNVEIASLAMGVLNRVPFATDPRTVDWVADSIDVMPKLGVKVCLLAFFGDGDISGDREKQDEVIRRLERLAPQAEKANVILGLETTLDAEAHMRIVDTVDSPAVKVYYDVANMQSRGFDIYKEIRQLGNDRICQFHMKERGQLLGDGPIDFKRVKEAIDDIGFTGWLVIESALVEDRPVAECYRHNQKFLRSIFPTA